MNDSIPYIIPPVLSLLVSLSLASIAIGAKPRTTERKLFALVCLWWGLLPPAFISHYVLSSTLQILAVERFIHFFYVFLPAIHILFVHRLLNIERKWLVGAGFLASGLLAATTPTDWYIYGLYRYDWGYIAKGGPAFQVFGLYGLATLVYIVLQIMRRIKQDGNLVRIRKQRYIIISLCMSGLLTLLNIPSMNGIDLYPAGNFLFVPLSILAYGVLKYRLMDIRSILLQAAMWGGVSSIVLVPNGIFLLWFHGVFRQVDVGLFVSVLLIWFMVNYWYIRRLQPVINKRFKRSRRHLDHAVKAFVANAVFLKDLDALVAELVDLMSGYLDIPHTAVFVGNGTQNALVNPTNGQTLALSDPITTLLTSRACSVSIDMIDSHPMYADAAGRLLVFMRQHGFRYLVPLVQAEHLAGIIMLPLPNHGSDLSPDELEMLDQLSKAGLAFSNSAIYKRIADLNDDLESRTAALTLEVKERQRIEAALRESEEKHRLMAENIKDVIWTLDMDLNFTYISPAAEKMQGWSVNEYMRFSLDQFMPPESVQVALQTMSETLSHGEKTGDFARHVTLELEQYTKSEGLIQTEVNAAFILNAQGRPCGILGVTRDITERIRAVKERETLQRQLARSKKMEALGLLAGGVAHDLNNILSGIMSYPEVIMMKLPNNSPLIKPLQTIQRSGQRAAAVVNDLVTIARGVASVREVTSLNCLIREHLASAEHAELTARHPQARVDTDLANDLLNIACSRIHIEKALMNLLANAMEALGDKGVVAVVTANRRLDRPIDGYDAVVGGDYVMLSVSDTGIGIAPEALDRIFEPFYTQKVMGRSGTGLGLAIVWNAVQDHDGYIHVTSGAIGTRFDIYLPATRSPVDAVAGGTSIEALKGNGESILVVDDDPTQREIASAMLTSLGYRVAAVESGEAAVAYVTSQPVDLLLLDMIMEPGMNGRETYQAICRIIPGQRALIASGFSDSKDVVEAQRLGANGFLKKPYAVEKLGQAVTAALASSANG